MKTVRIKAWSNFRVINILLVCYLSGCSSHSLEKSAIPLENNIEIYQGSLETLYNVEIRKNAIWATVKSNGCTSEKNFQLQLTILDEQQLSASIIRTKADFCRAMPRIVSIELFSEQLVNNTSDVIINNTLAAKSDSLRKQIIRK
jgi:hypothetical protein